MPRDSLLFERSLGSGYCHCFLLIANKHSLRGSDLSYMKIGIILCWALLLDIYYWLESIMIMAIRWFQSLWFAIHYYKAKKYVHTISIWTILYWKLFVKISFNDWGKFFKTTVAFVPKLSFCLTRQAFKGINNENDTRHRILASWNICAFFFIKQLSIRFRDLEDF